MPDPSTSTSTPPKTDETARLREVIAALTEISRHRLDAEGLMTAIVECAQQLTEAAGAVVELVEGDQVAHRVASGSVAAHRGLRLAIDSSLSGLCMRSRQVQVCADTETDPRVDLAACRQIGTRSMLVVPLIHGEEALGVLKVVSERPAAFDALDRQALQLSAGIIGAALGRQLAEERTQRLLVERTTNAERLRRVIEHSQDAFIEMDAAGRIREWNRSAEALFGWPRAQALGRCFEELVLPPAQRAPHRVEIVRFLTTGRSELIGRRVELQAQRRDGTPLAVEALINASRIQDAQVFDAFLHDISHRRAEIDSLRRRALYDPLTGLPNRVLLEEKLAAALARYRGRPNRLALMFVDLDGFKAINDRYGHEAGDAVLVETGRRLLAAVRERDSVARLAGDEFVVLLEGMRDATRNAAQVAEKIEAGFAEPVQLCGTDVAIHASIGIAVHDGMAATAEELTHRADQAMYQAKQAGGDGHRIAAAG